MDPFMIMKNTMGHTPSHGKGIEFSTFWITLSQTPLRIVVPFMACTGIHINLFSAIFASDMLFHIFPIILTFGVLHMR